MKSIPRDLVSLVLMNLILFLYVAQNSAASDEKNSYKVATFSQIMVTPERFMSKGIFIMGYFGGVDSSLYPTQLYADNRISSEIILVKRQTDNKGIRLDRSSCVSKYVSVKAKLISHDSFPALDKIKEVIDLKTGKVCWRSKE